MKRIVLLSCALAGTMSTFAQIGTVTAKNITTTTEERIIEIDDSKYNRISLSPAIFHYNVAGADGGLTEEYNGMGAYPGLIAEYVHGWRLMKSKPLYLESGLNFQINASDEAQIGLAVPVNLTYRFMNQKGYYISPFAGLNIGVHAAFEEYWYEKKVWMDGYYDYKDRWHEGYFTSTYEHPEEKFFQFGYNIGFNFGRRHWSIGIGYSGDIAPLCTTEDDGSLRGGLFHIGFGFNF